jgi:hypothetical protein
MKNAFTAEQLELFATTHGRDLAGVVALHAPRQ